MMKVILTCVLMLTTIMCLTGHSQQGGGAVGTPGVMDGSCWKGGNHEISVGVRGTMHGDQKVTVSEGDNSATGTGTPDPDGGCDDSTSVKVGDQHYRADGGKMQRKNANGDWIDMSKSTCPEPLTGDDETIGSLPLHASVVLLREDDELFGSLPA